MLRGEPAAEIAGRWLIYFGGTLIPRDWVSFKVGNVLAESPREAPRVSRADRR